MWKVPDFRANAFCRLYPSQVVRALVLLYHLRALTQLPYLFIGAEHCAKSSHQLKNLGVTGMISHPAV
jgi:hypothetical protein